MVIISAPLSPALRPSPRPPLASPGRKAEIETDPLRCHVSPTTGLTDREEIINIFVQVEGHHRKKAKEAKKLGIHGRKKVKKDPGIPNDWPFKDQEIKALKVRWSRALEELEQKKAARKERAKKRKLGLPESDDDVSGDFCTVSSKPYVETFVFLSQFENEYGPMESVMGSGAKSYANWAAKMAVGRNTGVPWIMCKQDDTPDPVISSRESFISQ